MRDVVHLSLKLRSQVCFSVWILSSGTDGTRISTNSGSFLISLHLHLRGCGGGLFMPVSPHASSCSEKSHHVINLPHVDAL